MHSYSPPAILIFLLSSFNLMYCSDAFSAASSHVNINVFANDNNVSLRTRHSATLGNSQFGLKYKCTSRIRRSRRLQSSSLLSTSRSDFVISGSRPQQQPSNKNTDTRNDNNNNNINEKEGMSIQERLLKISNIASLLCVVDCTVLPIITLALPILGLGASTATAAWLHELGHSVALCFVLPVGGLATTMNFLNHRKKSLLSLALVGLSCVYAANGHGGPILSMLPHSLAHDLHCGTAVHRVTNIVGCACLLSSNYLGKRIGGCGDDNCKVDHNGNVRKNRKSNTMYIDMECGLTGCDHDHDLSFNSRQYSPLRWERWCSVLLFGWMERFTLRSNHDG